jgi:hypothetical protein
MFKRVHPPGMDAIACFEDVLADTPLDPKLLAAIFRATKQPAADRYGSEHLNQGSGDISPRASRLATHALAAIPDGIRREQLFDGFLVAIPDQVDHLPGIIGEIDRSRADGSAYSTVETGLARLVITRIFGNHRNQIRHKVLFLKFSLIIKTIEERKYRNGGGLLRIYPDTFTIRMTVIIPIR